MRIVRLENNEVLEIIPEYALPVEKWYGKVFAAECVEAPDDVEEGWIYSQVTGVFSEPRVVEETKTRTLEEAVERGMIL